MHMKKREVLERAKEENLFSDEAKNYKRRKGSQWGMVAALIVIMIFGITSIINGKQIVQYFAILSAYIGFEEMGKYRANREKLDLLAAIGGLTMFSGAFLLGILDLWNL